MACTFHNRFDTVVAYVREELSPAEQDAFETHYFDCEECAHDVLWVEKSTLAMQRHGQQIFAPAYAQRVGLLTRWADYWDLRWEKLALHLGRGRVAVGYALVVMFAFFGFWMFEKIGALLHGPQDGVSMETFFLGGGLKRDYSEFTWPSHYHAASDAALYTRLEELRRLYQQKKYTAVAQALEELAREHPDDLRLATLHGISLFEAGVMQEAAAQFSTIASQSDAPIEAHWFLALSYWQQSEQEQARTALRHVLMQSDTTYHPAARYMLKKLPPEK